MTTMGKKIASSKLTTEILFVEENNIDFFGVSTISLFEIKFMAYS